MKLNQAEKLFDVKVYPCFRDGNCLTEKQFQLLCDEMRLLTEQSLGTVPEYQCLLRDYSKQSDKLIVIHRDENGKLDAFSSSIVIKSNISGVDEILHYGLFVVSPDARHHHVQFKLGLAAIISFLACSKKKNRYWITNLSSVLGSLAIVDKMFLETYPGTKKVKPDPMHTNIAKEFQEGVVERCYIANDSVFDAESFIYRRANMHNCFLKKSSDSQYKSLSVKHNNYFADKANLDDGDAVLQVCYITRFRIMQAMALYVYRVIIRDNLQKMKVRRKHVQHT